MYINIINNKHYYLNNKKLGVINYDFNYNLILMWLKKLEIKFYILYFNIFKS